MARSHQMDLKRNKLFHLLETSLKCGIISEGRVMNECSHLRERKVTDMASNAAYASGSSKYHKKFTSNAAFSDHSSIKNALRRRLKRAANEGDGTQVTARQKMLDDLLKDLNRKVDELHLWVCLSKGITRAPSMIYSARILPKGVCLFFSTTRGG